MFSIDESGDTALLDHEDEEDEEDEETRDWLETDWRRRWSDELDDDDGPAGALLTDTWLADD